jgi:hypothetical protein
MLTFYINRAGRTLSATRRRKLEAAKGELRRLYGRTEEKGRERRNAKKRRSA